MNNSAHDDISIIGEYLPENLSTEEKEVLNIYDLIHEMQKADKLGPATIMQQKIQIQPSDTQDVLVNLISKSILNEGWLKGFLGKSVDGFTDVITESDIQEIEKNNMSLKLTLRDEVVSIPLDELILKLDIYEIGRPSTIGGILEKMTKDEGLLSLSESGVSLTDKGREVYDELQIHFQDIANINWNLRFNADLINIEDDSLPSKDVLLSVFESIYGVSERKKIENLGWENPDTLHEVLADAEVSKLAGVIEIGTTFEGW